MISKIEHGFLILNPILESTGGHESGTTVAVGPDVDDSGVLDALDADDSKELATDFLDLDYFAEFP